MIETFRLKHVVIFFQTVLSFVLSREKYLKNMLNNQFLKVKNSLLELEKDFMELKDRELKDREEKKLKERQKNYFIS